MPAVIGESGVQGEWAWETQEQWHDEEDQQYGE